LNAPEGSIFCFGKRDKAALCLSEAETKNAVPRQRQHLILCGTPLEGSPEVIPEGKRDKAALCLSEAETKNAVPRQRQHLFRDQRR
jgi:hypothetical protein